jgi:hypothetical protein
MSSKFIFAPQILEVVSKLQIAFESPASLRDFAYYPKKINVLNKRRPMKKRSPAVGGMSIYFEEVCNAAIGR